MAGKKITFKRWPKISVQDRLNESPRNVHVSLLTTGNAKIGGLCQNSTDLVRVS